MTGDGSLPNEPAVPERLDYRSLPALFTAIFLSGLLLVAAGSVWVAIGPEVRRQISWPQAGTLLFFVLFMIGMMLSIGYSRLWADHGQVIVRNGPVVRKYPVDKVAGLRLRDGDAWAYLLIKTDVGTTRRSAVLAIQHLEGALARTKMRDLRFWLKANGGTSEGITHTED